MCFTCRCGVGRDGAERDGYWDGDGAAVASSNAHNLYVLYHHCLYIMSTLLNYIAPFHHDRVPIYLFLMILFLCLLYLPIRCLSSFLTPYSTSTFSRNICCFCTPSMVVPVTPGESRASSQNQNHLTMRAFMDISARRSPALNASHEPS
jgi:hypothetical protein